MVLVPTLKISKILAFTSSYLLAANFLAVTRRLTPHSLERIKKKWARKMFEILECTVETRGSSCANAKIIVANHISYLDIPLIMTQSEVSFVAKHELSRWPLLGSACRRVGTIFVKRNSKSSRFAASTTIKKHLVAQKASSIAVFPSGTTSVVEARTWSKGIFQIALDTGNTVQPCKIKYSDNHVAAFINDDAFIPHLWNLTKTRGLKVTIEYGQPTRINDAEIDCETTRAWVRDRNRTYNPQ